MKDEHSPPIDRRHRRALARAAQNLHVALRPLKGSERPEFAAMKRIAEIMARGDIDVTTAKRMVIETVPNGHGAGVLSIINLHARKEGLDPFEGFGTNPNDEGKDDGLR